MNVPVGLLQLQNHYFSQAGRKAQIFLGHPLLAHPEPSFPLYSAGG